MKFCISKWLVEEHCTMILEATHSWGHCARWESRGPAHRCGMSTLVISLDVFVSREA